MNEVKNGRYEEYSDGDFIKSTRWYKDDPAYEHPNGLKEWWFNGVQYSTLEDFPQNVESIKTKVSIKEENNIDFIKREILNLSDENIMILVEAIKRMKSLK